MANPFLLLVLLATVVLSDFTGKNCNAGCRLSKGDEDPYSCSCYICITDPTSVTLVSGNRRYGIGSNDLAEGPAYEHHIVPPSDESFLPVPFLSDFPQTRAKYANPISHTGNTRCPAMTNYKQYLPFAKPDSTDLSFVYHSTDPNAKPRYEWQTFNSKKQWIHSAPMLWLLVPPNSEWIAKNKKRLRYIKETDQYWISAFKMVRDSWEKTIFGGDKLNKYKNLPQLHYKKHTKILNKDPCGDRRSFAICTYCFSLYSMCTLYSVVCPICFHIDMNHTENRKFDW